MEQLLQYIGHKTSRDSHMTHQVGSVHQQLDVGTSTAESLLEIHLIPTDKER